MKIKNQRILLTQRDPQQIENKQKSRKRKKEPHSKNRILEEAYQANKKIYINISEKKKKKNILTGEYPMKQLKTRGAGRGGLGRV